MLSGPSWELLSPQLRGAPRGALWLGRLHREEIAAWERLVVGGCRFARGAAVVHEASGRRTGLSQGFGAKGRFCMLHLELRAAQQLERATKRRVLRNGDVMVGLESNRDACLP